MAFGGGIAVRKYDGRNDANGIADHLKRLCKPMDDDAVDDAESGGDATLTKSHSHKSLADRRRRADDKTELTEALAERDDMWRKHERAQIAFLQNDHANMLKALHDEIERLQQLCRELQARLTVSHGYDEQVDSEENVKLKEQLRDAEEKLAELTARAEMKDAKMVAMEQKNDKTVLMLREQLGHQADRIRQLSRELHERTTSVTQLSTQLRNIRLKEAMAQQRRRASFDSPKRSPTGPGGLSIRLEQNAARPQGGLVRHATVSVTYPTPSSSTSLPPIEPAISPPSSAGNIEKPPATIFRRKPSIRGSKQQQQQQQQSPRAEE
uniref:CCDC92/74 N-terminal domain-containing protein n=1 Tax=Plectus sambesii TaxID=2011161 RepID=A0A914XRQ7_9BILA